MSTQSIDRTVQCNSDCRQSGCPKHKITLSYHNTSDTVAVYEDGKHYTTFDRNIWRALVNMDQELRNR